MVDTKKGYHQYQDQKSDESIFHSINSVLVNLGSKMKRRLHSIATSAVSDITERKTFLSHSRHLKSSAELIAEISYILIRKVK